MENPFEWRYSGIICSTIRIQAGGCNQEGLLGSACIECKSCLQRIVIGSAAGGVGVALIDLGVSGVEVQDVDGRKMGHECRADEDVVEDVRQQQFVAQRQNKLGDLGGERLRRTGTRRRLDNFKEIIKIKRGDTHITRRPETIAERARCRKPRPISVVFCWRMVHV